MARVGRRRDDAPPGGKALPKAGNDLAKKMDLADRATVKPDDGCSAEVDGADPSEPFCRQSAHRLVAKPRLPAKPRAQHNPGGDIDQIEQVRQHAASFPGEWMSVSRFAFCVKWSYRGLV